MKILNGPLTDESTTELGNWAEVKAKFNYNFEAIRKSEEYV